MLLAIARNTYTKPVPPWAERKAMTRVRRFNENINRGHSGASTKGPQVNENIKPRTRREGLECPPGLGGQTESDRSPPPYQQVRKTSNRQTKL